MNLILLLQVLLVVALHLEQLAMSGAIFFIYKVSTAEASQRKRYWVFVLVVGLAGSFSVIFLSHLHLLILLLFILRIVDLLIDTRKVAILNH